MKQSERKHLLMGLLGIACFIFGGCGDSPGKESLATPVEAQIVDGMTEAEVIAILGEPTGRIFSGNLNSILYPGDTVQLVDGRVTNAADLCFSTSAEYVEKPVLYKGKQMSRAQRDRLMCRELRAQGRLGGKNQIVVVDGKIFTYAKNERFISPFDEEGMREYYSDDPLIHRTVLKGNIKSAKLLMTLNPGLLHKLNKAKEEPLHTAACIGNLELVKWMVKKGADVNAENTRGCTPLFLAAFSGHNAVADYLIRNGADVNHVDDLGFTAMAGPRRFELDETIRLLKRHGAR
jgi:hypothetical protein